MSRWDDGVPDDWAYMDRCVDCKEPVFSMFSTEGPKVCVSCAVEEAHRKPGCVRCHQPVEAGPLCSGCEAAIEANRERVIRGVKDKWPVILRAIQERVKQEA